VTVLIRPFGGPSNARPYSDDLRERVIEAVEAGASRRERDALKAGNEPREARRLRTRAAGGPLDVTAALRHTVMPGRKSSGLARGVLIRNPRPARQTDRRRMFVAMPRPSCILVPPGRPSPGAALRRTCVLPRQPSLFSPHEISFRAPVGPRFVNFSAGRPP
jgi:hypothetical protein